MLYLLECPFWRASVRAPTKCSPKKWPVRAASLHFRCMDNRNRRAAMHRACIESRACSGAECLSAFILKVAVVDFCRVVVLVGHLG